MLKMFENHIKEGKNIIKISEFKEGFDIFENKILVVLTKKREFIVCRIKSELDQKELKLLKLDLDKGLRKIKSKILQEAPITVVGGESKALVYYDDLMIIRTENGVITFNIIG